MNKEIVKNNDELVKYKVGDTYKDGFVIARIYNWEKYIDLELIEKETGTKTTARVLI